MVGTKIAGCGLDVFCFQVECIHRSDLLARMQAFDDLDRLAICYASSDFAQFKVGFAPYEHTGMIVHQLYAGFGDDYLLK